MSESTTLRSDVLAFLERLAALDTFAWYRAGEDVVTMSRADHDRITATFAEAAVLAESVSQWTEGEK